MKREVFQRDKNVMSFILTLFLSIDFMNYMIGTLWGIGGMLISLAVIAGTMLIQYKTVVKVKFPATAFVFFIVIVLYYIFTRQISATTIFGREFAFYFCVAAVLGMYKFDVEKLLRYLGISSLVILFFYNVIFIEMSSSLYKNHIAMALSYAMLPSLFAAMFHFLYYRKCNKSSLMYIVYIIAGYLLVKLAFNGTRGIILSIVVAAGIVYIKGIRERGHKGFRVARAVLVLSLTVVVVVNFNGIAEWLNNLFDSWGIRAFFLDKILSLKNSGDVSNGRTVLLEYTIPKILKSPVFGHGIGTITFNSNFKVDYAHNFIIQILYDGGLVLAIPVLWILVRAGCYMFSGENKDEAIFTLFMFAFTIPRALVTGDIWENAPFWLFIMHSLAHHIIKKKLRSSSNDEKDSEDEAGDTEAL